MFTVEDASTGLFRASTLGFNLGECVSLLAKTGVWRWSAEQVLSQLAPVQAQAAAERVICSHRQPPGLVGPEHD